MRPVPSTSLRSVSMAGDLAMHYSDRLAYLVLKSQSFDVRSAILSLRVLDYCLCLTQQYAYSGNELGVLFYYSLEQFVCLDDIQLVDSLLTDEGVRLIFLYLQARLQKLGDLVFFDWGFLLVFEVQKVVIFPPNFINLNLPLFTVLLYYLVISFPGPLLDLLHLDINVVQLLQFSYLLLK